MKTGHAVGVAIAVFAGLENQHGVACARKIGRNRPAAGARSDNNKIVDLVGHKYLACFQERMPAL